MAKDCVLERTRVEGWRLEAYYEAYYIEREERADLTFATFIREAMDAHVQRVTGKAPVDPEDE